MSTINTQACKCVDTTSQLHHQSATDPSLATHAAGTDAAHQCHERDNDVIFTSRTINKQIAYTQRVFVPISRYVKIIKIHEDFPEL